MKFCVRSAAWAGVGALTLASAATPALAEGSEIYFGVEGALLQSSGDPFEGFGSEGGEGEFRATNLVSNDSDPVEPENGWGGRIWVDVPLPIHLTPNSYTMLRGSANGAWLDDDYEGGGVITEEIEQEAELDAFWATLEVFNIWLFGPLRARHTRLGLGGGLEFADVENTFQENFTVFQNGSPVFSERLRQETVDWGVGPRFSGFFDHELGQSGVHIFAEAGAAYLAGGRDTEYKADFNGQVVREKDGGSSNVLHTNVRLGVGYVVNLGGLDFRVDVGVRQDRFNNVNNVLFLPEDKDGDSVFSGPFAAIGVDIPFNMPIN